MAIELDTTSFERAVDSLQSALAQYDIIPNDFIRDSCIQRFEYAYELSWKMLKRFLKMTEPSADAIDEMTFPELIRTGSEKGLLLTDWGRWKDFRKARNITSHGYDAAKADKVFSRLPAFLDESRYLLKQLRKRTGAA